MPPILAPLRAPQLGDRLGSVVWLQGPEVTIGASPRPPVVLVDFWESTCVHCLDTLPALRAWHERYAERGLAIVGAHTPEFEVTKRAEVVRATVAEERLAYSIVLDNHREIWSRFANHYWPAKYLIDARGYLRYEHFGGGAFGETERWIQRLLREAGEEREMPPPLDDSAGILVITTCARASPECFLGNFRRRIAVERNFDEGEVFVHSSRSVPDDLEGFAVLRGRFRHQAEYVEALEAGAEIEVLCTAAGVHLVVEVANEPSTLEVLVDGNPVVESERGPHLFERNGLTLTRVERPRMVTLVRGEFNKRRVVVRTAAAGIRFYSFAFTGC